MTKPVSYFVRIETEEDKDRPTIQSNHVWEFVAGPITNQAEGAAFVSRLQLKETLSRLRALGDAAVDAATALGKMGVRFTEEECDTIAALGSLASASYETSLDEAEQEAAAWRKKAEKWQKDLAYWSDQLREYGDDMERASRQEEGEY